MEQVLLEHLQDLIRRSGEINDLVFHTISDASETSLGMNGRELIRQLISHCNFAMEAINKADSDTVITHINNVAWCSDQIGLEFQKSHNPVVNNAGQHLREKSANLRLVLDNGPGSLKAMGELAHLFKGGKMDPGRSSIPTRSVAAPPMLNINTSAEDIEASILKFSERMADFRLELSNLEDISRSETDKALGVLKKGVTELGILKDQTELVAGYISSNVIAGSFEESAEQEAKWANNLRYASLVCMMVIGAVLIFTLLEASLGDLPWQQSMVRVIIAFLMSVPAAYLARESAKHREQQYHHLQTSLDLKAAPPFVASLPLKQQNKIKAAIADRIFSGRDFSKVSTDSYPINLQELLVEALRAIDRQKEKRPLVNAKNKTGPGKKNRARVKPRTKP